MSNVIRFLESMGSDPSLARLSPAGYAAAVSALELDDAQRQALQDRDAVTLNALLGGQPKMYCAQFPGREDHPAKREDDAPDDEPQENEEPEAPSSGKKH